VFRRFSKIYLTALRVKDKETLAGDERPKLAIEQFEKIFETPSFQQQRSLECAAKTGTQGAASGLSLRGLSGSDPHILYRREKLCGLMVDDVVFDNGPIPYIHIAPNKQRRIKNPQSRRNIPLNPEVLRLSFCASQRRSNLERSIRRRRQ
jgi:hypothetical protein